MVENTLDNLIDSLRNESNRYAYSSKPLSFNNTEAYQAILAIGKDALPSLLAELKQSPDFWLLSILKDITGVNIATNENRGKFNLLAQAWLDWGKSQDIILSNFIE